MPHCGGANSCNCVVTGDGVSGSGTLSDPYVITSVPEGGGGGGVTDHGALTGLADDDHPQYALADGTRGTFATTAQGAKADTAVQPAGLTAGLASKVEKSSLPLNVKDYGAVGDGATDDRAAFVSAIADAVSTGRSLYVPYCSSGYYWSSAIPVTADRLSIESDGAFIVRKSADAVANAYALSVSQMSRKTTTVTANITEQDEYVTVASTTGLSVGQVIKITTDEVYTQIGATAGYYYKGWMAKVSEIVSGTQVKTFEKAPYDFAVGGYTVTADFYDRGDININLNIKWTGTVGAFDVSAMVFTNCNNLTVTSDLIEGNSSSGITLTSCYNANIVCKEMLNRQASIGLNYGIMAGGLFYSTIEGRFYTTRHPLAFTGVPSWDVRVVNSYLNTWHGDSGVNGASFDAHCAGLIRISDSTLPKSIKFSGSYLFIDNCELGNVEWSATGHGLLYHRNSTFTKTISITNSRIRMSQKGAYLYMYQPDNYLLDYGDFIFENNVVTSKNTAGYLTLISGLATAVQPNSVGLVSIKNNVFDLNGLTLHGIAGTATLKAVTQGTFVFEGNTFRYMENGSLNLDTLFSSYVIKNNRTFKKTDKGMYFYGCTSPQYFDVLDNDGVDLLSVSSIGNGNIKRNVFRTTTSTGIISALQTSTELEISDNVLESKVAANTSWFWLETVANVRLGKNTAKVAIANIYNGAPTNAINEEVLSGTALPTPSIRWRGQYFMVLGGAGVADTMNVCVKNAADAYVWAAV